MQHSACTWGVEEREEREKSAGKGEARGEGGERGEKRDDVILRLLDMIYYYIEAKR